MFEIVNDRICWHRLYEYIRYKVIFEILFSYFKISIFKNTYYFCPSPLVRRLFCYFFTALNQNNSTARN